MSDAKQSGAFSIGGALTIHRLGFGAMRLTGPGIWGEPVDPAEAIRLLRRLRPGDRLHRHRRLLRTGRLRAAHREALHPYAGLVDRHQGRARAPARTLGPAGAARVSDPAGAQEPAPAGRRADRPLAASPHRPEGAARRAVRRSASLLDGASFATRAERGHGRGDQAASKDFPVATVQNRYNLATQERGGADHCESHGIGFIPWFPLGAGELAQPGSRSTRSPQPRRHRRSCSPGSSSAAR